MRKNGRKVLPGVTVYSKRSKKKNIQDNENLKLIDKQFETLKEIRLEFQKIEQRINRMLNHND